MTITLKENCAGATDNFLACDLRNQILWRFSYHKSEESQETSLLWGIGQSMYEAITGAEDQAPDVQRKEEKYLYGGLGAIGQVATHNTTILVRRNPTEKSLADNDWGPTMNYYHYAMASSQVKVFLDNRDSFNRTVTYLYYADPAPQEATVSLSTLFAAWFWSALLTEGSVDNDGYWAFTNRSFTEDELTYLFSQDPSLAAGWALLDEKAGMPFYSDFLTYLIHTSPQAFANLPFYTSHLAEGKEFSFTNFDKAALERVADKIQPPPREPAEARSEDGFQIEIQDLLTWKDPIMAVGSGAAFYNGTSPVSTGRQERYAEIEKASMTLPPTRTNEGPFTHDRKEFIDLILGPLFGNIEGLSELQFQSRKGAENLFTPNPVPAYLNARTGPIKWLTSTTQETKTMKNVVMERYFNFIELIIKDSENVGTTRNQSTVRQKFNKILDNQTMNGIVTPSVIMIYQNTENISRVSYWQLGQVALKTPSEGSPPFQADVEADKIIQQNIKRKNVAPYPPPVPDRHKLTQQDIAGRQRFFKQCALLLNAQILKKTYRTRLAMEHAAEPTKIPFDGRLYMLEVGDGDEDKLINVLTTGGSVDKFFDLTPAEVSALAPKIQLFRVTNDESSGKLTQTEFVFPRTTSLDRGPAGGWKEKTTFLTEPFDKGDGMGLKEFSFNFNGTNPAEARKDIQATLVLYFQSFADLVRDRKTGAKGKTYKYVDLIIHPRFRKSNADKVPVHRNEYDPQFYRIRVDVGYHKGSAPPRLHEALEITNASYYLNMVDHDIKIAPDGSVTLTVNYQAYQETALKSNKFDALATPAMVTRRKKNMETFREMLLSGKCTEEQIQDFKLAMAAQSQAIRKQSLSSIMRRLSHKKKIYMCRTRSFHFF